MSGDFPEAARQAKLDRLVADRVNLAAQAKQIADLIADTDAALLELLSEGEAHAVAQGGVRITPPVKRFSASRAAAVLTDELYASITVPTVSSQKAKDNLPPTLYDLCREASGKPSVRVVA